MNTEDSLNKTDMTPHEPETPEGLPPRPEFDENPAIIDAHRVFVLMLMSRRHALPFLEAAGAQQAETS